MKFLLILFIVSLIFPTDVRPFEVKKAGRAVPASRLDEIQKSTSKPESDQMAKLQEQILKRMYEKKLAQEQEGSSELFQNDIVADVIAETESPAPVPSEELLNDAQGSSFLSDEERQPEDISSELPDPEVVVPVEEGQIPSSVDIVQEPEVDQAIPQAPPLPPAFSLDKPVTKGIIKVKTKDWGEKYAPVAAVYAQVSRDREDLKNLREKYISKYLSEREKENPDYVSIVRAISAETIKYINQRFDETVAQIGPAPTKFCVFSMGSLAREESGFFTDLEIGILVQEKTSEVLEYFKKFSQIVSDRFYLLGEHPDVGGKGFRMDEADNSPIHLKFDKRYMSAEDIDREVKKSLKISDATVSPIEGSSVFLVTPKEMAKNMDPKYRNNQPQIMQKLKTQAIESEVTKALALPENEGKEVQIRERITRALDDVYNVYSKKEKAVAGSFPALSRNLIHLYGDREVFDDFVRALKPYLDGGPVKKSDKYETLRQEIAFDQIRSNTNSQAKKQTAIATGVLGDTVDLKRQLYRYVEQILTNLSFYHDLGVQNGVDIANELSRRGLMDKVLADRTIDLVNYLIGLRLRKQEKLRSQGYAVAVTLEQFEIEQNDIKAEIDKAKAVLEALLVRGESSERITEAEMNVKNLEFKLQSLEKYRPADEDSILGPDQIKDLNEKYLPILHELYERAQIFLGGDRNAFSVSKKTQIEAHLSLSGVKEKIKKNYFQDLIKNDFELDDLPEMVQQMNTRAQELADTHYDFYHAQPPALRVNQDAYKAFYEFFAIKAAIEKFTFLRCQDPIFGNIDSVEDFLKKQFEEKGIIDDNKVNFFLLSVNLSPFGNVGVGGESTYDYYFRGSSANPMTLETQTFILTDMLKHFGLDEKFIPRLQEIGRSIDTITASFYQIFVPKDLVDKIGYLSWRLGIPLDEESIEGIFGQSGLFTNYKELQDEVNSIRKSYEEGIPVHVDVLNNMLKSVTTEKNRLSNFLNLYRINPTKIMNKIQARLLFTNDVLLNPDSGVIIYRYTDIPREKLEKYQKELANIVDEILIDWLEKNSSPETTQFSGKELDRIKNLLAQMKMGREFEGQEQIPAGKDILSQVRVLQELKQKQSEVTASSEKQSEAVTNLEQRLEQERQGRMKDMVTLHDKEKKDSEKSKQLSPFEALERQRQIREEKIRKGESLSLEEEPKIEPGKISQKRLDDLVDTLEYKKEPLPVPGKLKGEQADVKNQLEKIFGKKSDAEPAVSDEIKPLPSVGKVNPAIQKELEKFFAAQKQEPKKIQQPVSTEKEKTPKSSSIVKKIEVKPGEIPPPPPLPMPSIKKIPAASPAA